jgi:hypothetical protein
VAVDVRSGCEGRCHRRSSADFGYRRIRVGHFFARSSLARGAWVNLTRRSPKEGKALGLVVEERLPEQESVRSRQVPSDSSRGIRCYISRLTIQGEEVRALDSVAVLERVDLTRGWDGWDAVDSTYLGRHMRIWA